MASESVAHSAFSLMAIDSRAHSSNKYCEEALATYLSDCKSMLF